MTKLRVTAGGYAFVAQFQSRAPKTVAAFMQLLPYREKIVHVRWSGEACWIPLGDLDLGVGFENHTCYPSAGDLLFYPGGFSETEILLAYGSCSFASKMGPLAGNHFSGPLAKGGRRRRRRLSHQGRTSRLSGRFPNRPGRRGRSPARNRPCRNAPPRRQRASHA